MQPISIRTQSDNSEIHLQLDLTSGIASISRDNLTTWKGSLLPAFLLTQHNSSSPDFYSCVCTHSANIENETIRIHFQIAEIAQGELDILIRSDGLSMRNLTLRWTQQPCAIIAMYFGASTLTAQQCEHAGIANRNWLADWQSWGVCIPSAKVGPMQSVFRCFEFGQATFPLGSFGPSMGTPYAAAFPRPVFSVAMGNENTWACFGAGQIPDAALSFKTESSNACIEWLFREDLWGAPKGNERCWPAPLEITLGAQPYETFARYFDRFSSNNENKTRTNIDMWANWGEFKNSIYDIRTTTNRLASGIGGSLLVIDEGWETFSSSGEIRRNRFPEFEQDLEYMRAKGVQVGLWQSVGWLDDIHIAQLTENDVLCGVSGKPIKVDWAFNARSEAGHHYCPDPSSADARRFIRERSLKVARELRPDVIKLDFSYGLPGPNTAAPKDPAMRGEMAAYTLLKTAADAFKSVNPDIRMCGFTLHPLFDTIQDFVSMDDLGDSSWAEADGHRHWAVWASLLGRRGMPVNTSSAFNWQIDHELLLNAAVLGAPGGVLRLDQNNCPDKTMLCARKALHLWYRRPASWKPLWFDSTVGDLNGDARIRSWARIENINGKDLITAAALRGQPTDNLLPAPLKDLQIKGSWAIISQDNREIFSASTTAIIPLPGSELKLTDNGKFKMYAVLDDYSEIPISSTSGQYILNPQEYQNSANGLIGFLAVDRNVKIYRTQ